MKYFEGLRVVEVTQGWVGPMIARILGELGAQVVKIERTGEAGGQGRPIFPPRNDLTGEFWNRGIYFAVRNLSKRAVMVDIGRPEGRDIALRLLAQADVLVENFQPRVMKGFGLDWPQLKERFPRLIMLSVSGYGQDGPYSARPANGVGMEPSCGVASVTGYVNGPPLKTGQTWIDPLSGLYGVACILAALRARERTGRGQYIDVSMHEHAIATLAGQIADYQLNGRLPSRTGNRRPGMVRGTYRCRGDDDWVAISARTEAEWQALCGAVGHPEWLGDARFAARHERWAHHDDLDVLLAAWARARTKFEAMTLLQEAGVPAAAVLKADEVIADPQLVARGFFDSIPIGDFGRVPIQRYVPAKFDGTGIGARSAAPKLGEHTEEVLGELGLDAAEIERLKQQHVIDGGEGLWSEPKPRPGVTLPYERFQELGSILRIDPDYQPAPS